MAKRENDMNKLKDLIPQMLEQNKLKKGMDQIYIKEAWGEVMGNGVLNYTESVMIKNQVVFVKLSSAPLREELEYGREKILKMLDNSVEQVTIKALKFI